MPGQRLLLLLFLFLFSEDVDSLACPVKQEPYATCRARTVYVMDSSSDLTPTQVEGEYNWMANNVLPRTQWNQDFETALFSYDGFTDMFNWLTNDMVTACYDLADMLNKYKQYQSQHSSLLDVLASVNGFYGYSVNNAIIFSANTDVADIKNASDYARTYMHDVKFTVIALGGSLINETNFPAIVYHVDDLNYPPDNLARCILVNACDYDSGCTINGTMPSPTVTQPSRSTPSTFSTHSTTSISPSTHSHTSPTRSTTITSTQTTPHLNPSTITTTPSSAPSNYQCQCDTMSAWVDMIFVIDASASTGDAGLNEMWGIAGTMVDLFNVQKTGYTASNYTSRVGIVTYGNSATVVYPLGSLDNDMVDNLFDLPFNNDPRANLEAGIMAAASEFNGPNHRNNARKVMIIMAAAFNPEGQNAPNKTAQTFKEDDGIIIVYNYVPEHGIESPMLASLASPGYFLSTTLNSQYTDMALAMCDANCFCRSDLTPYGLSNNRFYPTKGCYAGVLAGTNYARASNNCKLHYYNGIVSIEEDTSKAAFLKSILPTNAFYIGLTYDNMERNWLWPDGTTLGSYQPWVGGKVPDGTTGQCAFVDSNSKWQPTDCRNGYYYICEVTPCDTVNYCV